MKRIFNLTLAILLMGAIFSCSKDDSPTLPKVTNLIASVSEIAHFDKVFFTFKESNLELNECESFLIVGGNDDDVFSIDQETGDIKIATGKSLDFESKQAYTISIRVTTAEQASTVFNLTIMVEDFIDPVVYYNFNNTLRDTSSHKYHLINDGGVFTKDPWDNDLSAILFDGSTGSKIEDVIVHNQSEAQSMSFWFRTDNANSTEWGGNLFTVGGYSSRFGTAIKDGKIRVTYGASDANGGEFTSVVSSLLYNDNVWHNAVLTSSGDGGVLVLYVDGELVMTESLDSNKSNNFNKRNAILKVGGDRGANYYTGEVDEVMLFDRVLTNNEVNTLYNR